MEGGNKKDRELEFRGDVSRGALYVVVVGQSIYFVFSF